MKAILAILLLAFSLNVNAMNGDSLRTEIICEEGYKFLIVYSSYTGGPVVTQIMEQGSYATRPPQPMRCDGKRPPS